MHMRLRYGEPILRRAMWSCISRAQDSTSHPPRQSDEGSTVNLSRWAPSREFDFAPKPQVRAQAFGPFVSLSEGQRKPTVRIGENTRDPSLGRAKHSHGFQ